MSHERESFIANLERFKGEDQAMDRAIEEIDILTAERDALKAEYQQLELGGGCRLCHCCGDAR